MSEIRLPLPTFNYRFELLLEFVKRIAFPARMVVDGDMLWRYTDGQLLSYRQVNDEIVVSGAGLSAENVGRIQGAAARWLGLERDLTAFYESARADDKLASIIEPLRGLPIFCTETIFEALITLIIEQHITWKTALRSQRTLMQLFGCGSEIGKTAVYDFPAPRQLARATPLQLKPLKITNGRSAFIINISQDVCSGRLDLESLRALEPRAAYDWLLGIKGVGHWTANNVIGRAFGQYPLVSENDVALQAAVQHYFYGGEGEKSAGQVTATLGKYGEYAGLAGHFVLLRWVLDRYPTAHG